MDRQHPNDLIQPIPYIFVIADNNTNIIRPHQQRNIGHTHQDERQEAHARVRFLGTNWVVVAH